MAQLYGFPGHKTSRTRETLVCRGAKPFATNFLASPSRPRASFTISSFLASNLRGEIEPTIGFNRGERKDETSKIRSLLANVPREEESRTKFGKLEGSLSKKSLGNQLYHGYIYIYKKSFDDLVPSRFVNRERVEANSSVYFQSSVSLRTHFISARRVRIQHDN